MFFTKEGRMTEALRDQLIRHEGLRLKPYIDTVGKLTIGVGRNLTDVGISKGEALMMLDSDIQKATDDLRRECPWVDNLNWARKAVLINMTFNMGINRLLEFKQTLTAAESGEYKFAAVQMLDSVWAKQVRSRATELSTIMETGVM